MESSTNPTKQDVEVNAVNDSLQNLNVNPKDDIKETTTAKEKEAPSSSSTTPLVKVPNVLSQCEKDEYLVKTIDWKNKEIRIITQNENGPCPLVAICNVLFLRGDLVIQPPDREVVSFEYLVDRLGDYLLTHAPVEEEQTKSPNPSATPRKLEKRQGTSDFVLKYRHNLDSALSILPNLKYGLDVNVKFDEIHGFEPTAELAMFDLFNVELVHGWIVDPQAIETYDVVVKRYGTYNNLVECIVQADEINTFAGKAIEKSLSLEDEEKLHQGFLATEFLKDTATQLTYYGLNLLLESIPADTLCVLFRNNHFSTVYRHANSGLFMLVTDSGLVPERSIVWESLGDVDQSSSEFCNGNFEKPLLHAQENSNDIPSTDIDYAIAVSLQQEQLDRHGPSQENHSNTSPMINAPSDLIVTEKKSPPNKKQENKCVIS